MPFFSDAELYSCKLEITRDKEVQIHEMQAPQMFLIQQFMSLMQQASHTSEPIKIKMIRDVPIYDNFDSKWLNRECFVGFTNNAYLQKYPEQE